MATIDRAPSRRAGRPRREGADEAILLEAIALVREKGYADVTLDGIARRAGVAKTTLYRRWSSKAALIAAALNAALPPIEANGSADPWLGTLGLISEVLSGESGRLLAAVASESAGEPEVEALLWRVLRPDALVALAEQRGANVDRVTGAIWLRAVVFRESVDDDFLRSLA